MESSLNMQNCILIKFREVKRDLHVLVLSSLMMVILISDWNKNKQSYCVIRLFKLRSCAKKFIKDIHTSKIIGSDFESNEKTIKKKTINLVDPINHTDTLNKKYVDDNFMKISNNWWDADGKTIYNLKRAVYDDEDVIKGQTTKSQISQTKRLT